MGLVACVNKYELGRRAAKAGANLIRNAINERGSASIIVATGASQFEMLEALVKAEDIEWEHVTAFHLDEYVGMSIEHPASFCKYLQERFVEQVPIGKFHFVNGRGLDGNGDVSAECARLNKLIGEFPVDVAFVGIGENAHLAFNDPPADFDIGEAYLVVDLDEDCRKQQLGEGWFKALEEVPSQAISMSIRQIMKSKHIICSVPDQRKAKAVRDSIEGPVIESTPASILQQHKRTSIYLDPQSASLLQQQA